MSLGSVEKKHVEDLCRRTIEPANGMELHFLNVIGGKGRPVTNQEKEWVAYWDFLGSQAEVRDIDQPEVVEPMSPPVITLPAQKSPQSLPNAKPRSQSKILDTVKRQITDIEFRTDLTNDQKISQITHIACATCAGVAIQPIPFADIFILTPIQAYFGTRIAAIRGVPVTEAKMGEIIREIFGVIGLGVMAQQVAIAAWKFIIPGGGGFVTIPLVYALTYAIMKVVDLYFIYKSKGQRISDEKMKQAWNAAFNEGKKKQKQEPKN